MSRNKAKIKFRKVRQAFRKDLRAKCDEDPAFRTACILAYRSFAHFHHITKMWNLMIRHPAYREEYNQFGGEMLAGGESAWTTLYSASPELFKKYQYKFPECYAMGDMLGAALASQYAAKKAA
ncbi:hypothetical protein ABD91_21010 [Lysinibacillus sphaericus]|uniref:hypothetical protein n=1 Tax=Lysinibacillus sphaericus TaxID=1421 RepID=UPI0018CD0823|nr:hypothetical protein [Lysinibacillus sphaericus]MBG9693221.1 hypothetical protein [Lysinibacillus sphaericus]